MDFAEAGFFDMVAEGRAAMLVTVIDSLVQRVDSDPETETGTLKVTVRREITSGKWLGPDELEVTFTRFKEPMHRMKVGGGWNDVEIEPGRYLLLAVPEVLGDNRERSSSLVPLTALAVEPLKSPEDEYICSMEKALEIERTQDISLRTTLLREGLQSNLSILSDYAHYALGRLQRIPRESAVQLELAILSDNTRPAGDRDAALINLDLELWKDGDPNDSLNQKIVETAFAALLTDNKDFQEAVLLSLYGVLVSEAPEEDKEGTEFRIRLTAGMKLPSKESLLNVLHKLRANPDVEDEAAWMEGFIRRR